MMPRLGQWWGPLQVEAKIAIISTVVGLVLVSDTPALVRWLFVPRPKIYVACEAIGLPASGSSALFTIIPLPEVPQDTLVGRGNVVVGNRGRGDASEIIVMLQVVPFQASAVEIQALEVVSLSGARINDLTRLPFADFPLRHEAGFRIPSLAARHRLGMTISYLLPPGTEKGTMAVTARSGRSEVNAKLQIGREDIRCQG